MKKVLAIHGDKVFYEGDEYTATGAAQEAGVAFVGQIVTILTSDQGILGIHSETANKDWGDLSGLTKIHHGLWMLADDFSRLFTKKDSSHFVISEDLLFKKRNLKGLKCSLLTKNYSTGECLVELEVDVGGGSGDGLCESGKGIIISKHALRQVLPDPNVKTIDK